MPIRPENRARYPADWPSIRAEVLERAGQRCEGSPAYPECRVADGDPHPVTRSKVVLTIGHLNHEPEDNGEPGNRPNLKAWCQRCHNTYDAPMRRAGIAARRAAAVALAAVAVAGCKPQGAPPPAILAPAPMPAAAFLVRQCYYGQKIISAGGAYYLVTESAIAGVSSIQGILPGTPLDDICRPRAK